MLETNCSNVQLPIQKADRHPCLPNSALFSGVSSSTFMVSVHGGIQMIRLHHASWTPCSEKEGSIQSTPLSHWHLHVLNNIETNMAGKCWEVSCFNHFNPIPKEMVQEFSHISKTEVSKCPFLGICFTSPSYLLETTAPSWVMWITKTFKTSFNPQIFMDLK